MILQVQEILLSQETLQLLVFYKQEGQLQQPIQDLAQIQLRM